MMAILVGVAIFGVFLAILGSVFIVLGLTAMRPFEAPGIARCGLMTMVTTSTPRLPIPTTLRPRFSPSLPLCSPP